MTNPTTLGASPSGGGLRPKTIHCLKLDHNNNNNNNIERLGHMHVDLGCGRAYGPGQWRASPNLLSDSSVTVRNAHFEKTLKP